jgi:uncharacterized protein (DUF1330 family)
MVSSPDAAVRRRAIGRDIIMKTRYTVALSMIAGVALGATAIQGLHAQAKKVYFVSESQILDRAGIDAYNTRVQEALKKAGGTLVISDKITAVVGDAPQRVGISEFPSVEKVQAWLNSTERKDLGPQRDKVLKFTQQYIVEGH